MTTAARILLLASLSLPACAADRGDDACVSMRKLSANALLPNKLSANGILDHGLSDAALHTDALDLDPQRLADPAVRDVLAYAVQCALEPEQSVEIRIDGVVHVFAGALGLAPEWGEAGGACDDECRGWVSACLAARLNAEGESVVISLRGEHPGLAASAKERAEYSEIEATYFGDVFADPPRLHACVPPGATELPRVCGDDPVGCVVDLVGPCEEVCDDDGCRAADGRVFPQSITVQRGPTAACR